MASTGSRLTVLILAAGKGQRLRSKTIKLLHPVAGLPMVARVAESARALKPTRVVTVVGYQADLVRTALADYSDDFVLQAEQRGTGHAVLQAARKIGDRSATLLIINGDLPTLRPATLRRLVSRHRRSGSALTLLSARVDDPTGYGRVLRNARGEVTRIVEHKDATSAEREVDEINCGIYCTDPGKFLSTLRKIRPDNAQGEYYITDAVHALLARGDKVTAVVHDDAAEGLGVNTREELAQATRTLYERKAAELMDRGVTLMDPSSSWIDPRARVGRDTVIWPGVLIEGDSRVGQDCVVRRGCRITDSVIGNGVEVRDYSIILESRVGRDAQIGPFAHLRPGTRLDAETRVGNFVELKKTHLGQGSKASHLAYLGDATIGQGCNVGAGTITCNYDGTHKHRTVLGDDVFIGSDSQLVAPVTLERGAYVAAGSTVTHDVPPGALAICRARQLNIEGWVARRKQGGSDKARRKARK